MIEGLHQGIVCLLVVILFLSKSKKQAVVAQSTTEVEYRVMALGLSEMLWMRSLLFELRVLRSDTMMLHCDNKSAINMQTTQFNMIALSMWRLIGSSLRRILIVGCLG